MKKALAITALFIISLAYANGVRVITLADIPSSHRPWQVFLTADYTTSHLTPVQEESDARPKGHSILMYLASRGKAGSVETLRLTSVYTICTVRLMKRIKPYKRVQVELRDTDLHARAKARAASERKDLWELVERAIRMYLTKPQKRK